MHHTIRFTYDKLKRRLEWLAPFVYRRVSPLMPFRYLSVDGPAFDRSLATAEDLSGWAELRPGDYWAATDTHFVLRTTFAVPPEWKLAGPVGLYLPLGDANDFSHPEALAWIDGQPYAACDRHHQEILLDEQWLDGRPHILCLQGWAGYVGGVENYDPQARLYLRPCALVQVHPPARDFLALARVGLETVGLLDEGNPIRHNLLNALDAAFNCLDMREPLGEDFYKSFEPALAILREGITGAGRPLDVRIHASGHAHLDVAWLWTLGQTRQKAARTFHNVLRLMEQFPEYHFSQSQPQLYEFVRQDFPDLFEGIRRRVAEGRWEPLGGMWVEADCNLSGAESLVRQFLLGRTYFREHFGSQAESPVLWLPDVFGYAWALPQLIRQAGLNYFMTIKIGWNETNRFPYDTFLWQGLDGTRILTHFSTVKSPDSPYPATYNSMASPGEALGAWLNFQQKDMQQDLLMAYGFGDGGGGPTREMLENIRLMGAFPGLPQVKQSSVRGFFEAIEPLCHSSRMPVWDGELYLEYHRGTYTSQARNKRANRKSEFLLHDAEFLAAWAALLDGTYSYPAHPFTDAWRTVCLNQFHDILPGSSIAPVYVESQAQYARLQEEVSTLRDQALEVIADSLGSDLLLVNPTGFSRNDLAFVPGLSNERLLRDGQPLVSQPAEGGLLIGPGELAPYSVAAIQVQASDQAAPPMQTAIEAGGDPVLENDYLRVEMNSAGDIVRILDKTAGREVLAPGAIANQFQAFEDRPRTYDAWEIEASYEDKVWLAEPAESIRWIENGPLRQTLEIRRRILNSDIIQRISLRRGSPRLDFDTTVQWRERHILLKAAFPVEVLSPFATYEIQWGSVQRPTHRNTSWDWARFETCAHKWVDLSEGGYGVSLLNDCKYGHDIHGNVLRISLVRSPAQPDPLADEGEHHFIYSLLPHAGPLDERTAREAYALNDPIIVWRRKDTVGTQASGRAGLTSLVRADAPNVIIETVKRAEDGQGLIVRLYESQRRRGRILLETPSPLARAWETNLLEENQRELAVEGNRVTLDLRPFQIVTLRLVF
jgi:alpha-mannosidase